MVSFGSHLRHREDGIRKRLPIECVRTRCVYSFEVEKGKSELKANFSSYFHALHAKANAERYVLLLSNWLSPYTLRVLFPNIILFVSIWNRLLSFFMASCFTAGLRFFLMVLKMRKSTSNQQSLSSSSFSLICVVTSRI